MISWAFLIAAGCVVVQGATTNQSVCNKKLQTVHLDPKTWEGGFYINLWRAKDKLTCSYVWNHPIPTKKGDVLLWDTWTRFSDGVETVSSLHARQVSGGVYEFMRIGDVKKVEFTAQFVYYQPKVMYCVVLCSSDKNDEERIYCKTKHAIMRQEDACNAKKAFDKNNIDVASLGLVDNCNCDFIPYDKQSCEGAAGNSSTNIFQNCK